MRRPEHIVIAGGGVAAVETVVALRVLAGPAPRITLVAPETALERRASSVAAPFGLGGPVPLPLSEVRAHARFDLLAGRLTAVDAEATSATLADGGTISYDALVVATGARPRPALDGAVTFAGPRDAPAVAQALAATAARSAAPRVVFTMPVGPGWALPVYELAMMAAVDLRDRGVRDARITVVTPEPAPLWTFGPEAGETIARLLDERGIALRSGALPVAVRDGELKLRNGVPVPADCVIALPRFEGPAIGGLPHDDGGFIPVDAYGRVAGADGVFAAGDATTFPLKQGGLATQQADTVAEVIAAACGAEITPRPFRPVLRGLLLTGGAPLYLRSALSLSGAPAAGGAHARHVGAARPSAEVSTHALWWPPGKVAGRYLAPLLATARPSFVTYEPMLDLSRRGGAQVPQDGPGDALALALLLADHDAEVGDFAEAVHALDAAAALCGGELPVDYAGRRAEWVRAGELAAGSRA